MFTYLIRRILYLIPILICVNVLTFLLFFYVNSPDDIARIQLGQKYIKPEQINHWKQQHGYDLPLFYQSNPKKSGLVAHWTETIFFKKSVRLLAFDFGISDTGQNIAHVIQQRYGPSLLIAIPSLILGVTLYVVSALFLVLLNHRRTLENALLLGCVVLMSISALFYLIFGQFLFATLLRWFPISGYSDGVFGIKFLILPVLTGVIMGIGGTTKWYRTLFIEEIHKDYIRTAYAKGLSDTQVLFRHLLKNSLIPILTGVVAIIPSLFLGSLIMESFFAIPGLGSYTLDAIRAQDFTSVQAMVFLGTLAYLLGLILTDLSYAIFDPRVRLS